MEVYKRKGSPNWYFDLNDPATGLRVRKSLGVAGPKTQAQKLANVAVSGLVADAALAEGGRKAITVEAAVAQYIRALASRGKVFADQMEHTQRKLFGRSRRRTARWCLDSATMLHDLTPAVCEELSLARTAEGNKPQTIKHELGLLRSACRYAVDLGFREPSAMKGNHPWRIPEVTEKTRYLSQEEYAQVYAYLDPDRPVAWGRVCPAGPAVLAGHDRSPKSVLLPVHIRSGRAECRDLLVALAYTGGRWSEVALLTWDRVDLAAGTIRLWGNKTQQERVVPISEPLERVLTARKAARSYPTGLVFPGPGGRPRTAASRAIGDAMTACGLNTPAMVAQHGKATVHSLRHTFASWLIQNGAELGEVSHVLGHSSIAMTQRYAHLSKGATVAKLGAILTNLGGSNG